jgi:hypothetical protein
MIGSRKNLAKTLFAQIGHSGIGRVPAGGNVPVH